MTNKHEIIQAYHHNQMVGICSYCIGAGRENPFQWLPNARDIQERLIPPVKVYQYYTHGICIEHMNIYEKEDLEGLEKCVQDERRHMFDWFEGKRHKE